MRQLIRLFALGASLGAALLCAQTPSLVAIQDARIVTASGAVIEKGTVVISNGVIADVGPSPTIPKGAWIVDGKGLTVYPGLIDALSTYGLSDASPASAAPAARGAAPQPQATPAAAPAPRSNGPQDRPGTNSWVKAADTVKPTGTRLEQARGAGFTTAVAFPRTGLVAGHGAVVDLGGETGGAMVVEPSAGLFLSMTPAGYTGFPASPMGVLAYFRQLWIDADYYKQAKALYARKPAEVPRPAYDRALEGVLEAKRILLPAANPIQLERMLHLAGDLKAPYIFYGVTEGYRMSARLKQTAAGVILNVKWPTRERDSDPETVESLRTLELRDKAPSSPAVLAAEGVKFAVSSDGIDAPRDVIRALKKSIDLGLKKEDALRALTLSAAEIFGVDSRLGSIDKGKIANLIVTTGDLFDDKTKVQMVFVDGVKYLPPPEPPQTPGAGRPGAAPSQEEQ